MALYHKHRPQLFGSILGQDHINRTLTNQLITGKVAHAYLFFGPRGVGKTTTARVLAKALNCPNRPKDSAEPCDTCDSCQTISQGRAIDVLEIDAASHTGVDSVREHIIDNAQMAPSHSPYKIFIIDEVHMLSTSAFNALLKTLEEPPAYVVFILATTDMHKLPETIISRCQRFHFKKVPHDALNTHLQGIAKSEGVAVEQAVIDRIIDKSDGGARDAVGLLDQLIAMGDTTITSDTAALLLPMSRRELPMRFCQGLIRCQAGEALAALDEAVAEHVDTERFADQTLEIIRLILIKKMGHLPVDLVAETNSGMMKRIDELVGTVSPGDIVALADLTIKRRGQIRSSPLPTLPLELIVIEWCGDRTPPPAPPKEIVKTVSAAESAPAAVPLPPPEPEAPAAPKKTLTERVKDFVHHEPVCTKEEAETHWRACIAKLGSDSPSLVVILRLTTLSEVDKNIFRLKVPFPFYQGTLMSDHHKRKIQEHLSVLVGTAVAIDVDVEENKTDTAPTTELQGLAAAFGGEVVG